MAKIEEAYSLEQESGNMDCLIILFKHLKK